jgi:glycosyltransferase involved in cell wall biosynthesis
MVCSVIEQALLFGFPVFVVNDGSTDNTPEVINGIKGITVLHHKTNLGKGAALKTGFKAAAAVADWAITVDADGQHNPREARRLLESLPNHTKAIVVGVRSGMDGVNVPWTSRFGRLFSNFWVYVSGGPWLKDTQSGFRIYPLPEIAHLKTSGQRYQFEVEVLVKANWSRIPVIEVPISVRYAPGNKRVSHFKPWLDFLRNSTTFTRLIVQRIIIPPVFRKKMIQS